MAQTCRIFKWLTSQAGIQLLLQMVVEQRWWEKFIKECSNIHRITISVHLEYADIKPYFTSL